MTDGTPAQIDERLQAQAFPPHDTLETTGVSITLRTPQEWCHHPRERRQHGARRTRPTVSFRCDRMRRVMYLAVSSLHQHAGSVYSIASLCPVGEARACAVASYAAVSAARVSGSVTVPDTAMAASVARCRYTCGSTSASLAVSQSV